MTAPSGQDPNNLGDGGTVTPEQTTQSPTGGPQDGNPDATSGLSPEATNAELARARQEAAQHRIAQRELSTELKTLKEGLAKALGLKDSDTSDVTALQREITKITKKLERAERKATFDRVAQNVGAKATLTYALLSSTGRLNHVDWEDEAGVAELIKSAVSEHPELKAGTRRGDRTGVDSQATPGGNKKVSMNTLIRRAAGRE